MILKKHKPEEKAPEVGDFKITRHFAWLPQGTSEGVIWLEKFRRIWEYSEEKRFVRLGPASWFGPILTKQWDLRVTRAERYYH